ncbi:SURF1 family protein [Parasalinivibrio latis]|uniref:SURF1 family protein n=1 Tax=Parasalinivibrio latis TaxID=2952610 RepID=UPI0030E03A4B
MKISKHTSSAFNHIDPPQSQSVAGNHQAGAAVPHSVALSFTLFTLILIAVLVKLGFWQLSRADEKADILSQHAASQQTVVAGLSADTPVSGQSFELTGSFDLGHAFFLDNQTHKGRVGYQLYLPFTSGEHTVLVDVGWLAAPALRSDLPPVPGLSEVATVKGTAAEPTRTLVLDADSFSGTWPWRVQAIEPELVRQQTGLAVMPWVLHATFLGGGLDNKNLMAPNGLVATWQPVVMRPEKHHAYAVQWFTLAFAVAVMWGVWWRRRSS